MPKRQSSHMEAQRERILRATIRCIGNFGLEHTSITEICKEAGLSVGALYTHFTDKDAIIAEALRFGAMTDSMLPDNWREFAAAIASTDDQMGFDIATVARTRLQLLASAIRPGPLHDTLKPPLEELIAIIARHLEAMEQAGRIKLRMSALQTAMSMSALADGLTWIGLASDRTWTEISADVVAGLDCLIDIPFKVAYGSGETN